MKRLERGLTGDVEPVGEGAGEFARVVGVCWRVRNRAVGDVDTCAGGAPSLDVAVFITRENGKC